MKFLVAPQGFKGTYSPWEAAKEMAAGIQSVFPHANCLMAPIADGGDGTLEVLMGDEGQIIVSEVTGPLGEKISADWGINHQGIPIIETAKVCGLNLVPEEDRNPLYTTTYGVGELIKELLDRGHEQMIIGVGGSATNDGGVGMAQALGAEFFDANGNAIGFGGAEIGKIATMDLSGLDARLNKAAIVVACDVRDSLFGAIDYSAQKGARKQEKSSLLMGLKNLTALVGGSLHSETYTGSAGGLAYGLAAFLKARLFSGANLVMDALKFDELIKRDVLFVVTGEGCLDGQTIKGKAPGELMKRAVAKNIPVLCIAGKLGYGYSDLFDCGLQAVVPLSQSLKLSAASLMKGFLI